MSESPQESPSPTPISIRRKFVFSAAVTLMLLGLGELGARLIGVADPRFPKGSVIFDARGGLDSTEVDAIMVGDADLFWRLKPNLHGRPWLKPLWIDTRTNSIGLRTPEVTVPKPPESFRILCLGDSCTYGSGVRMGEAYPALLEQTLGMVYETGVWEVVNGGVPGYSSFQGLEFLKREGLELEPDIVTLSFWFNDSSPWSGRSDAEFHRDFNPGTFTTLMKSALVRAVASPLVSQPDLEAVARERKENPSVDLPPRASADQFRRQLEEMVVRIQEGGASPVLILHPWWMQIKGEWPDGETGYQQAIRAVAEEKGLPLLDLFETLKGRADLFIDNCHLKAQGNRLVAKALFELLISENLIPPPPTLEERRRLRMNRILPSPNATTDKGSGQADENR